MGRKFGKVVRWTNRPRQYPCDGKEKGNHKIAMVGHKLNNDSYF